MSESYAEFQEADGSVRMAGQLAYPQATPSDVLTVQDDGTIAAAAGGGGLPDPITTPVNIVEADPASQPLSVNAAAGSTTDIADFYNSDGFGTEVHASGRVFIGPAADGLPALEIQPTSDSYDGTGALHIRPVGDNAQRNYLFVDSDTSPSLILGQEDTSGLPTAIVIDDASGKLGFYATAPVAQPVVPMTTPLVQNVIDALVALGLVAQHD